MTYQRINFKDQNVERPKTFDVTNNSDGSITLIDSFGKVEELGTPINSETMGHIEDALESHDNKITELYDISVNKSGDTMTGALAIERTANPDIVLRNTTIDIKNFETPTVNTHMGRYLIRDKNNVSVGDVISRITTSRNVETYMDAITYVDGVAKNAQIKCGVTSDGTAFTSAPTVATGDSSSNIATTKWVNNMSANIAGWTMPSGESTSITIKASKSTYTAPANGYFQASKLKCDTTDWMALTCSGLVVETKMSPNAAGDSLHIFIPCKKGASVKFEYNLTTLGTLKFVYAEGAK